MQEESVRKLMQLPGTLRFTARGEWYHDNTLVSHRGIAEYFSKHLTYSSEHSSYVIAVHDRCVVVEIEDTAHVVRSLSLGSSSRTMLLSDGSTEPFNPQTVCVNQENVFYCRRADDTPVRLLSPAVQSLLPHIEARATPDKQEEYYVLCLGEDEFTIRTKIT